MHIPYVTHLYNIKRYWSSSLVSFLRFSVSGWYVTQASCSRPDGYTVCLAVHISSLYQSNEG